MGGAHIRKIGALESIRKFCVACMGGSYVLVAQCDFSDCAMHAFRLNRPDEHQAGLAGSGTAAPQPSPEPEPLAPALPAERPKRPAIRAIRRQCLNCCCGDRARVRACAASPKSRPPFDPCPLWRYRLGSRPEILERRLRKARHTPLTLPGLTLPGKSGDTPSR